MKDINCCKKEKKMTYLIKHWRTQTVYIRWRRSCFIRTLHRSQNFQAWIVKQNIKIINFKVKPGGFLAPLSSMNLSNSSLHRQKKKRLAWCQKAYECRFSGSQTLQLILGTLILNEYLISPLSREIQRNLLTHACKITTNFCHSLHCSLRITSNHIVLIYKDDAKALK